MKIALKIAALMAFALALAGCSDGPSESDISEALSGEMGFVEVKDVEKVNSYKDGDRYVVDVSYTLKFNKSFQQAQSEASGMDRMAMGMMAMMYGKWNAGDTFESRDEFQFVDSENGWITVE